MLVENDRDLFVSREIVRYNYEHENRRERIIAVEGKNLLPGKVRQLVKNKTENKQLTI